ncbi:hypothetical protein [Halobellus rufus]|nr:hypothetical protein [Halobellus rufus]
MRPNVRPTRRGYAVLGVATAAFAAGTLYGPRTLDAVVLPAVVALVAGVLQVWRTEPPEIERRVPSPDEPGTTGRVEVSVSASRPYPVTLRDRLPPGIDTVEASDEKADTELTESASLTESVATVDATAGGASVAYRIERRGRGRHEIGPASVDVTDVLGLVRRTHEIEARDAVVVYPPVRPLSESIRGEMQAIAQRRFAGSRDEFDTLREYVSGDASGTSTGSLRRSETNSSSASSPARPRSRRSPSPRRRPKIPRRLVDPLTPQRPTAPPTPRSTRWRRRPRPCAWGSFATARR